MKKGQIFELKIPCTCGAKVCAAMDERDARIIIAKLRGAQKTGELRVRYKIVLPGDKGFEDNETIFVRQE